MRACIYILLLFFSANAYAQTPIFEEWTGELIGVCNVSIKYTLLDANTDIQLNEVIVSSAPYDLNTTVPNGFCSVKILVEATGIECDTGEECEPKFAEFIRILPDCCTTICLQDGTEVSVNFEELTNWLNDNNLNVLVDWENMPNYPEPLDSIGVTVLNDSLQVHGTVSVDNFPEFPTHGVSCEDASFTEICNDSLNVHVLNQPDLYVTDTTTNAQLDSLITCINELKADTCETYIVEKCVLCWGTDKGEDELVTLPAKYNCCTGEYDYLDKQDELIFEGANQNAEIVECNSCFQTLHFDVLNNFNFLNDVTLIEYCDGGFWQLDTPTNLLDIDFEVGAAGSFPYVETILSATESPSFTNVIMVFKGRCVNAIYKEIDGELVELTDFKHPIKNYGNCCECTDDAITYTNAYYCVNDTTVRATIEYANGIAVDTTYLQSGGNVLTALSSPWEFGKCPTPQITRNSYTICADSVNYVVEEVYTDFDLISQTATGSNGVVLADLPTNYTIGECCCAVLRCSAEIPCETIAGFDANRVLTNTGWNNEFNTGGAAITGNTQTCFTIDACNGNSTQMIGLNNDFSTSASYNTIDYAFYIYKRLDINSFRVYIYENGTYQGLFINQTTDFIGTEFCIRRVGTTVQYSVAGSVIYTSTVPSTQDLYFDNSFYSANGIWSRGEITISDIVTCPFNGDLERANTGITPLKNDGITNPQNLDNE